MFEAFNKTRIYMLSSSTVDNMQIINKFVQTKNRPKEGTKIKLPREISQVWLQVVHCRFFSSVPQVVSWLFVVRDPSSLKSVL